MTSSILFFSHFIFDKLTCSSESSTATVLLDATAASVENKGIGLAIKFCPKILLKFLLLLVALLASVALLVYSKVKFYVILLIYIIKLLKNKDVILFVQKNIIKKYIVTALTIII